MYDLNGNDYISKEELLAVLTMMVGANIKTEQLLSIAERTIIEADTDHDNLISFEEFAKVTVFANAQSEGFMLKLSLLCLSLLSTYLVSCYDRFLVN